MRSTARPRRVGSRKDTRNRPRLGVPIGDEALLDLPGNRVAQHPLDADACLILGMGVGLVLLTGAPLIIGIIGGPKFHPADAVLSIQGLALVASFVGAVWGFALLSLRRHRAVLVCSLASLALSVTLTTTLAAADGARGAAIATVVVEALYSVMLGIAVWRAGEHPAISRAAIPRVDVVRVILAVALYGGGLLALRAIPREIVDQLPRRLRLPLS